jgi:hypothetical protein
VPVGQQTEISFDYNTGAGYSRWFYSLTNSKKVQLEITNNNNRVMDLDFTKCSADPHQMSFYFTPSDDLQCGSGVTVYSNDSVRIPANTNTVCTFKVSSQDQYGKNYDTNAVNFNPKLLPYTDKASGKATIKITYLE